MKFKIPKSPFIFIMKPYIQGYTRMSIKKNKKALASVSSHF